MEEVGKLKKTLSQSALFGKQLLGQMKEKDDQLTKLKDQVVQLENENRKLNEEIELYQQKDSSVRESLMDKEELLARIDFLEKENQNQVFHVQKQSEMIASLKEKVNVVETENMVLRKKKSEESRDVVNVDSPNKLLILNRKLTKDLQEAEGKMKDLEILVQSANAQLDHCKKEVARLKNSKVLLKKEIIELNQALLEREKSLEKSVSQCKTLSENIQVEKTQSNQLSQEYEDRLLDLEHNLKMMSLKLHKVLEERDAEVTRLVNKEVSQIKNSFQQEIKILKEESKDQYELKEVDFDCNIEPTLQSKESIVQILKNCQDKFMNLQRSINELNSISTKKSLIGQGKFDLVFSDINANLCECRSEVQSVLHDLEFEMVPSNNSEIGELILFLLRNLFQCLSEQTLEQIQMNQLSEAYLSILSDKNKEFQKLFEGSKHKPSTNPGKMIVYEKPKKNRRWKWFSPRRRAKKM